MPLEDMNYYVIEPEVAGGWGEATVVDTSTNPPTISKLEYKFEGWQGDPLLESFPAFIVTRDLGAALVSSSLSGFELRHVTVTKSSTFIDLYPTKDLPEFDWLYVTGEAGKNDFGIDGNINSLVVSDKVMEILEKFRFSDLESTKWAAKS